MNSLNSVVIGTVYEIGNGSPGGRGAVYDVNNVAPTIIQSSGGGQSTNDKRISMFDYPGQFFSQSWRWNKDKKTSYGTNTSGTTSKLWGNATDVSIV